MIFLTNQKMTNILDNLLNKALYSMKIYRSSPLSNSRNLKSDLLSGYLNNEVVYSIINKISSKASNIPIILKDKNNNIIENHWVNKLLKYPNNDNSFQEILYSNYIYLLALGNSYLFSHLLPSKTRDSIQIMPSEEIEIITGTWDQPVKGYKTFGNNIQIDSKDVLHCKFFNPRFQEGQWLYGLSPIAVASQIIESYNKGQERLEKSFDNGGPENLVFTKENLSTEQMESFKSFFKSYEGSKNAKKNAYLNIPVESIKIGSDPVDLSILDSSLFSLRILCNVYNVPSILFNDPTTSTYNNINQARKDFYDDCIIPLNNSFISKFNHFLGIDNEGLRLEFDYSSIEVLQESYYTKLKNLNEINFLTDDEKRKMIGY